MPRTKCRSEWQTPQKSIAIATSFGPGARREDAPGADAGEKLWLTYYENIFNPARLKLKMMQKEMPAGMSMAASAYSSASPSPTPSSG